MCLARETRLNRSEPQRSYIPWIHHGTIEATIAQAKSRKYPDRTTHTSLPVHVISVSPPAICNLTSAHVFSPQWFRSLLCALCACVAQTFLILRDRRRVAVSRVATATLGKEKSSCADENRPSHADSCGKNCLNKHDEQFTSSTSFSVHSGEFYDIIPADFANAICSKGKTGC